METTFLSAAAPFPARLLLVKLGYVTEHEDSIEYIAPYSTPDTLITATLTFAPVGPGTKEGVRAVIWGMRG